LNKDTLLFQLNLHIHQSLIDYVKESEKELIPIMMSVSSICFRVERANLRNNFDYNNDEISYIRLVLEKYIFGTKISHISFKNN
jgi:hypothetical protein